MANSSLSFKTVLGGSFGSLLEWYDYTLYGFMVPLFGSLFFPLSSPFAQLMASFGVFAVAYLGRPIGSLFFGRLADLKGRQPVLILSVVLMGIMTTAIGLLPTFAQIGIWAPLLLLLVRLGQGLSVGGEYIDSAIYLTEHAPLKKRCSYSSYINRLASVGVLLATFVSSVITSIFSQEALSDYGWRIPFFLGIIAAGVGVFIRLNLKESPVYLELQKKKAPLLPFKEVFVKEWSPLVNCVGLIWLQTVSTYLPSVFLVSWVVQYEALSLHLALISSSIGSLMMILGIVIGSNLSDHLGRKPVLIGSALFFLLFSLPLFRFLASYQGMEIFYRLLIVQSLYCLFNGVYSGVVPTTLVESFKARNRCTVMSVGYNIAAGVFGGTTPLLCFWLIHLTGSRIAPGYYLLFSALVALYVLFFRVKESYRASLND